MKIIYVHHAERNITKQHNDKRYRQLEDITKNGIKDAKLLSNIFKDKKITAIYTSTYIRCTHTAKILNRYNKVPMYYDERFNEKTNEETKTEFLKRNISAIEDIVKKYNDDDTIVCVTSGVNLTAFICYFYNINPTENIIYTQGINCSPINFYINTNKID